MARQLPRAGTANVNGPATLAAHIRDEFHQGLRTRGREVHTYLERAWQQLGEVGIELPFRGDRFPLTPALLPESCRLTLGRGCRAIFRGTEILFREVFCGDVAKLADFLRLTPEEVQLYEGSNRQLDWAAMARPDFFLADGRVAVIETNVTTSIGLLADGDLLRRTELRMPILDELVARYRLSAADPMSALIRVLRSQIPDIHRRTVAIVDWESELPAWRYYYRAMALRLARAGIRAEPVALEALELRDGRVHAGDMRIDVIYRFFTTTRLRDERTFERFLPVLEAVRSHHVLLIGDFSHKLFTPKMFLALLSDEAYADRLAAGVRRSLQLAVPWTRLLEPRRTRYRGASVDLVELALNRRDDFVLKPNLGYGGMGVTLGSETTPTEWATRIEAALRSDDHWLLQERIPNDQVDLAFLVDDEIQWLPTRVDYGVFMLGRRFAGVARRNTTSASGTHLTNLSRGGGLGFALLVPGS